MSSVICASFTIEVPNSVQYLNPQLSFRNMIKFKMADMLDCWKPDYWPMCLIVWCWFSIYMMQKFDWRPNHGSNYGFSKIWFVTSLGCWFSIWIQNLVQKCWSTPKLWPKTKLKMAAVCHLGFSKFDFRQNGILRLFFPPGYQIWCKNVERCRIYGEKSKFKMAAVCLVGFSKT